MRNFIVYAALLILVSGCALVEPAEGFGSLAATITDAGGGAPPDGVLVAVGAPNYYRRHAADSDGNLTLLDVPAGRWRVDVHCPSMTGVGREIVRKKITISRGTQVQFDVVVPQEHCDEPAYSERHVAVLGYYARGFEMSNFTPCNPDNLNLTKNNFFDPPYIWVWFSEGTGFEVEAGTLFFVEAKGVMKGPGQFGHLGMSAYELAIDEVIASRPVNRINCRKVNR